MKKFIFVGGIIIAAFLAGNAISSKSSKNSTPKVQGVTQEISSLPSQQFNEVLLTNNYVLLDIRTTDEYAVGHIRDAKQIDYYQTQAFSDYLDTLDKKGKYLIYCRTGKRSNVALQIMGSKGFGNVYDLTGGYSAWVAAGLPITK